MNTQESKRHPLVSCAFVLTFFIFILPTYADLIFGATRHRDLTAGILWTLGCCTMVLIPLSLGSLITTRNPNRWSKSKLVLAIWVIMAINVAFCVVTCVFVVTKQI